MTSTLLRLLSIIISASFMSTAAAEGSTQSAQQDCVQRLITEQLKTDPSTALLTIVPESMNSINCLTHQCQEVTFYLTKGILKYVGYAQVAFDVTEDHRPVCHFYSNKPAGQTHMLGERQQINKNLVVKPIGARQANIVELSDGIHNNRRVEMHSF